MAPRKKKTEKETIAEIAKLAAEVTLGETEVSWPTVVKGSHLTVYTFEDGSTKLEWDDLALLRDVQQAILKHESNIPAATKNQKNQNGKIIV